MCEYVRVCVCEFETYVCMRSSCMRERVSVCVVSCGGGKAGEFVPQPFPERKWKKQKKKNVRFVRSRKAVLVWFGLVGVYCNPARSLASLCHRLSSLHHRWVCFIFVKEGRKRTPLDYRPPGRGPSMGLGTRELFRLTRLCR